MKEIRLEGHVGSNILGFTGKVFSTIRFELEESMRDVSDEYTFPVLDELRLGAKVTIIVQVEE